MPPKSNTLPEHGSRPIMPLSAEELMGLIASLKNMGSQLSVAGRPDYETTTGRKTVLQVAEHINAAALSFSSASRSVQSNGSTALTTSFVRVASSFEKMSSGMKFMHDAPRMDGQLTKMGSLYFSAGALSFTAGFISLFGSNGTDYSGAFSEIHSEINALRQEHRHNLSQLAEMIQSENRRFGQMLSQVMANQHVMFNAINHALDKIDEIKTLLSEHAQTTGAALSHIATKDLREAHFKVQQYLEGGLFNADSSAIGEALDKLYFWLRTELKNPIINETQLCAMNSERMVTLLNQQSPLNIPGLIAARLRFLFGNDILDEKYTQLPSLEVYQPTAALFLLGLQKSKLSTQSDCQLICDNIQETFNDYNAFISTLRKSDTLWRVLFNQYQVHRDKVGRALFSATIKTEPALYAMEEIRLLLTALLTWTFSNNSTNLYRNVSELDSMAHILDFAAWPLNRRKEYVEEKSLDYLDPVAEYRMKLQHGLMPLTEDVWSPLVRSNQYQAAVDCFYHNLSQDVSTPEHRFKLSSQDQIDIVGSINPPKPSTFTLGWSSGGNNWKNFQTIALDDNAYRAFLARHPEDVVNKRYIVTAPMLLLYLSAECGLYNPNLTFQTSWGWFRHFHLSLNREHHVMGSASNDYYYRYVYSINGELFTQPNREYSLSRMPKEARSIATHISYDDQKIYQKLLQYHILMTKGRHQEALALLKKQNIDAPYKASYLLFLVAILGHWDVWEAFSKYYPNIGEYNWTIKDGSWTPLMLAAFHGRYDVINGLLAHSSTNILLRCAADGPGKPARTAAEIALDEGYFHIAERLIKKQPNGENELSETGRQRYAALKSNTQLQKRETGLSSGMYLWDMPDTRVLDPMRDTITFFKEEFKALAERKLLRPVSVTASEAKVRAEESDAEQENDLENATMTFFEKPDEKLARPTTKCWRTPEPHQTGERVMRVSFFADRLQARRFSAHIKTHDFSCVMDSIDGEPCFKTVVKRDVG